MQKITAHHLLLLWNSYAPPPFERISGMPVWKAGSVFSGETLRSQVFFYYGSWPTKALGPSDVWKTICSLSQSVQASLLVILPRRLWSRNGCGVSRRKRAAASNSCSIFISVCCCLVKVEGDRETITKNITQTPPLPTLPCAPEVVCDSQRTQLVCLMLMTKELTPDLSAPDESPAAHWKSGLPHTVQHSQQRVTFKGCYKTLSCAIIRGWPQHADRTDGYKKTGQLSIHHPQRRGSVWWNIIDSRSLCTLVFLIKIIIISDFWFDCLEKNLFKVILNWQKAPVVLLLTVVRSDPNNLTTNCTWDNNWR